MSDETAIPEFSATQKWVIEVVAEKAADKAVEKFFINGCPMPCRRVEDVETVVFGRTEKGIVGLDQRMASVERAVSIGDYRVKLMWAGIGVVAFYVAQLLEHLTEHHILGF